MTDQNDEINKLEVAKQKLSTMEKSIKEKADSVDQKIKELNEDFEKIYCGLL